MIKRIALLSTLLVAGAVIAGPALAEGANPADPT